MGVLNRILQGLLEHLRGENQVPRVRRVLRVPPRRVPKVEFPVVVMVELGAVVERV